MGSTTADSILEELASLELVSSPSVSLEARNLITCRLEDSTLQHDCKVCELFGDKGGCEDDRWVWISDLVVAANRGCRSCLIIRLALDHFQVLAKIIGFYCLRPDKGLSRLYFDGGFAIHFSLAPNELDEFEGGGRLEDSEESAETNVPQLRTELCAVKRNLKLAEWQLPSDSVIWKELFTRGPRRCPSLSATLETIRAWLNICRETHSTCSHGSTILPTRVVDVGEPDGRSPCRLYETKGESVPYIALSHCWGPPEIADQMYKTTEATLDINKIELPWSKLSKTFQEAITLTRQLGIRYIWIDSLCIIQGDATDWNAEAARMGDIYKNAYVTLAATASSSGSGGLLVQQECDSFDITVLENGASNLVPLKAWLIPKNRYRGENEALVSDPLSLRAWAFQERLLSRRIVHFCSNELIWECKTDHVCRHGGSARVAKSPRTMFNDLVSQKSLATDGKRWSDIVEWYTSLLLTYEQDRLPALSGIAAQLFNSSNYLAGLSKEDLLFGLCWRVDDKKRLQVVSKLTGAPSWSWASVNSPVSWLDTGYKPEMESDTLVIAVSCQPDDKNPYGTLSTGSLVLSGRTLDATLTFKNTTKTSRGLELSTPFIDGNQPWVGVTFEEYIPDYTYILDTNGYERNVTLFLCYHQMSVILWGGTSTYMLVLERRDGDEEVYERMGIARTNGL
ncbi:hypothetical protein VTL71DRAFT_11375 [Oculimacula yallundae]|uniref:Heterokaryon incompatibility domain-containing protein n=1 Tax=Oculimacula yallundae TaxID=86028 RepID=A0ABR4CR26_9HELO